MLEVFHYETCCYDFTVALRSGDHSDRAVPVRQERGLSGAIGGVADSFLAKNKARTIDAKLARATKWFGAVFLVLTMALLIMN